MSTGPRKSPHVHNAAAEAMRVHRLSGPVFLIGTAVLAIVLGLIAAGVTWLFHPKTPRQCIANCPPPEAGQVAASAATGLAEEKTYTPSGLGYHVDYPGDWKVESSDSTGIFLDTSAGFLEFVGQRTTQPISSLISKRSQGFNPARIPDLKDIGSIRGAHLGSVQGTGELFSGTFLPSSGGGRGVLIRIGIIGARRNGVVVLATAILPYNVSTGKITGAGEVDYALTEFRWPGQ
jgi:hypothetical protein